MFPSSEIHLVYIHLSKCSEVTTAILQPRHFLEITSRILQKSQISRSYVEIVSSVDYLFYQIHKLYLSCFHAFNCVLTLYGRFASTLNKRFPLRMNNCKKYLLSHCSRIFFVVLTFLHDFSSNVLGEYIIFSLFKATQGLYD